MALYCQVPGQMFVRLCTVIVNGRTADAAPDRLATLPFISVVCGMKGGLPPNAVSRLIAVRSAKYPPPERTTVLSVIWYAMPTRGWNQPHFVGSNPARKL